MGTCLACGASVPDAAAFCPACGARIAPVDALTRNEAARPVRLSRPGPISRPPARALAAGVTLDLGWGRVVVGDRVGEGGMGTVHRGWLYANPRGPRAGAAPTEVAIKVLRPDLTPRPRLRRLFLDEARALSKLSHPNVVAFLGMCDVATSPQLGTLRLDATADVAQWALVLELVDGDPLSAVIERHVARAVPGGLPALPFVRAWHYFEQLLGALAATHAIGVVHRDVKPANLLLRRDGVAKLGDFGIARLPEGSGELAGMQPGTGAYMAPEQVMGGHVDARSDLYSAAVVLYEALSGRTLFDLPDRGELAMRAAQVELAPVPVSARVPQAPRALDALFARALAKDPAQRFASAIELGDAFLEGLGLPESPGWRAQKALASSAVAIAGPVRRSRVPTARLTPADVDQLRAAIAVAYRD